MRKKISNHKYLLSLYSRVDEFLSDEDVAQHDLPNIIVFFCTVTEKILKIKLYNKNPILVFDGSRVKDDNSISIIALKKEKDIETLRIENIINRFSMVFRNIFTSDELQALRDLYHIRNCFVHGYKTDDKIDFDTEDILKKMGTVWEKITKQAIILFGKDIIKENKPKKKYSEEELEKVLTEEVKKKIQGTKYSFGQYPYEYQDLISYSTLIGETCPRCGSNSFSKERGEDGLEPFMFTGISRLYSGDGIVDLYKCKKCHLELTQKEYEIAKKIKGVWQE